MADPVGKLCRRLLPADFERRRRQLPAVQRFLDTQLPEPLAGAVVALSVDDAEIVIAAASPPLANYLRLYQREIALQLDEALGRSHRLKIRTMPASAARLGPVAVPAAPRPPDAEVIDALERNARSVDDAALRERLLSLARTLRESG